MPPLRTSTRTTENISVFFCLSYARTENAYRQGMQVCDFQVRCNKARFHDGKPCGHTKHKLSTLSDDSSWASSHHHFAASSAACRICTYTAAVGCMPLIHSCSAQRHLVRNEQHTEVHVCCCDCRWGTRLKTHACTGAVH